MVEASSPPVKATFDGSKPGVTYSSSLDATIELTGFDAYVYDSDS